ncbi:MAG: ribokinase [Actinomycetia bacterium]|nr:ribokinase [Actinomycetes bacterium]
MSTVACVGIAVMDYLFQMNQLPLGGGKYYANSYREVGGGVAANAAVAVARLGGTAKYIGRVGDDPAGARIVADLGELGVDVGDVTSVPGVASPVSAVLVDRTGERTIINHTPAELFAPGTGPLPGGLGDAGSILVDVRWPEGAAHALAVAREAGIPSVFDFDRPMPDDGAQLIGLATHIAFSESALAATSLTPDPVEGLQVLRSRTDAWLAVTAGSAGVWWLEGEEVNHQPAFPVKAVDTVGAGDVFHGALALTLAEGQAAASAVEFASAAAALKCTKPGGRAGAPTRPEVEELLEGASG